MRKPFEFSQATVSITYYCGGSEDFYEFEARKGSRPELLKVCSKSRVAKLLSNGYRGSELHFSKVDKTTQKFFKHCAGIQ